MAPAFWAAAISQQNGSAADGIHLLWTTPPSAGASLRGYSIQRRVSQFAPKITCYSLTPADLTALHRDFRVTTPLGDVAVANVRCPRGPHPIPDEPVDTDGGGTQVQCVDFSRDDFPNASTGEFGPLRVRVTTSSGSTTPPRLATVGAFRGLDCGARLEIRLPAASVRVEATLVHFSRPATVSARDANGTVIATLAMTARQRTPEMIRLTGAGIVTVAIDAPQAETLLLRFCFTTDRKPTGRCDRLSEVKPGRYPNPLRLPGRNPLASYRVTGVGGTPLRFTEIRQGNSFTGLDCSRELRIRLTTPARAVRLTLVTYAPDVHLHAIEDDGAPAGDAIVQDRGRAQTVSFAGRQIREVIVESLQEETWLLSLCVGAAREARRIVAVSAGARRFAVAPQAVPSPTGTLEMLAPGRTPCRRYRITLDGPHQVVQVVASVASMLAIAMREGKAVDSRWSTTAGGEQDVRFEQRAVDEVVLYTPRAVSALRICVDDVPPPAEEERDWAAVPFIAKNIQFPLRRLDATLPDTAAEITLARSRILATETIDTTSFRELSDTMNDAAAGGPFSPVFHTSVVRDAADQPFIEMRPWPTSLAAATDSTWRRALGLGFLDDGAGLTPGTPYDYRISAEFYRRDLEETLLGFHTVPIGTTLPPSFHVGRVHVTLPAPRAVELYPAAPATALRATGRKGLRLEPQSSGGPSVTLSFDQPVLNIVFELEPALSSGLTYESSITGFVLNLGPATTFTGNVPARERVEITFASPVDAVTLKGSGLLYGVRYPFATAGPHDDALPQSVVLSAVRYEPTPAPAPPLALGTTNLQQALAPGDPATTLERKPQAIGFRLHWEPPPSTGASSSTPWPDDLGVTPPTDVLGYHIERRRVDVPSAFQDIVGGPAPTTFFGNRRGVPQIRMMTWGADVLDIFPETREPVPPLDPYITVDDVLLGPGLTAGPPPGSVHEYRIFSVDAIGRRSSATLGSQVRLEKRIAPPQPVGPPPSIPPRPESPGVRARILQKSDTNLPPGDVAILGASTNAVVLEWGWTAEERARDPLATEFRVYWQARPPDMVQATLTGTATLVGSVWEMSAALDQSIATDSLKGRYINPGWYPFKVASNTAGQNITIRFEPSALQPTLPPSAATVVVYPMLDGTELRPSRWTERTAVVPITAANPQPFVFRDRVTLDATHPNVRIWAGVSAADAQSYVPDELSSAIANGGRPGNESSIAPASAEAHYIGQPTWVPPALLPAIPELLSPEPSGDTVTIRLDLPGLLPTAVIPAAHQVVVERVSAGGLISMLSRPAGSGIAVRFPDNTTATYTLANPADTATLRAELATGQPAQVEGRFVADLITRFGLQFEPLWAPAVVGPAPFTPVSVTLPSVADRYLYRIRISDQAGHVSVAGAILPRIVRVVSTRVPGPPQLTVVKSATDTMTVTARVKDAFDIRWLLLFPLATDLSNGPDARTQETATLLRIPDRRDLYPNDGIRLRLADGTLIAPTVVDLQAVGVPSPPDRTAGAQVVGGYEKSVSVWGATMTRDGIPSRLAGPVTASTGLQPLVVPSLTVTSANSIDTATWGVPTIAVEISLERSTDGGTTWTRVSPWLPSSAISFAVPGSGARAYRLVLRRPGQRASGPAVTPS